MLLRRSNSFDLRAKISLVKVFVNIVRHSLIAVLVIGLSRVLHRPGNVLHVLWVERLALLRFEHTTVTLSSSRRQFAPASLGTVGH